MESKYIICIDWQIGNIYKSVCVSPNGRRTMRIYSHGVECKSDITRIDSDFYDMLMLEAWECNATVSTMETKAAQKASTACTAQYMDN